MSHRSVKPQRKQGALVVVETDGLNCRAAVVDVRSDVTVGQIVQSTTGDLESGLRECVSKLKGREGGSFPSTALLLTYAAVPASIEVPASAAAKRSFGEMQELLRWEVEPFLAQVSPPRLGTILVAQEALEAEDVQRVLAEQRNGGPPPPLPGGATATTGRADQRFGQQAIALGLLTRQQIERALEAQGQLRPSESDDLICGWTSGSGEDSLVASGMNRESRDEARRAFESVDLRLHAVYPVSGTSAAAVPSGKRGAWSLLELHRDYSVCVSASDSGIESIHRLNANGTDSASSRCLELLGDRAPPSVWLAGGHRVAESVAGDVGEAVGSEVSWLRTRVKVKGKVTSVRGFLAGIEGAVRHAYDLPGAQAVAGIPAVDPPLPLNKRQGFWWAIAAVLFAAAVGGTEYWIRGEMSEISDAAADSQRQLADARSTTRDIRDLRKAAETATKLRDETAESLQEVATRRAGRESAVLRREGFIEALLENLSRSVNPEVSVDRITEADGGVQIIAWSLSEPSAQSFVRSLTVGLARIGMSLEAQSVFPLPGRLGLDGFGVEVDFVIAKAEGDK
ncbi:MAG: hypothetical protein AAF517_08535 [Planctomycetota bacterium]